MDTEYGSVPQPVRNPMATAAIVFGIISLISCLFFYVSIPCGALAALFAVLSRSREPMPGRSKAGMVCGICGMILSAGLIVSSFWMVLTNAQLRAYMEYYVQYYLGDPSFDLDEALVESFPFLGSILGEDSSDGSTETPDDRADDAWEDTWPEEMLPGDSGDDNVLPHDEAPQDGEGVFI